MNAGEIIAGAVVVIAVGSQLIGKAIRSTVHAGARPMEIAATMREILVDRDAFDDTPNLLPMPQSARIPEVATPAAVPSAAKHRSRKPSSPHREDGRSPHGGGRTPLRPLDVRAPLRKLHALPAASAMPPSSPLSPYV